MRKMCASSKLPSRIRFSSRAEARSWPNGFSTMTRAPAVQSGLRELLDDRPNSTGGMAR